MNKGAKGILVCGLNGAGKSTLGRLLADRLGYAYIDSEDLYFTGTGPDRFSRPAGKAEAMRLLDRFIDQNPEFVFSSVRGELEERFMAAVGRIILVEAPRGIRLKRVRDRSYDSAGERVLPGGDLYEKERVFFSMVESRAEDYVAKWLEGVNVPVIRVDGTIPPEENVSMLMEELKNE